MRNIFNMVHQLGIINGGDAGDSPQQPVNCTHCFSLFAMLLYSYFRINDASVVRQDLGLFTGNISKNLRSELKLSVT